MVVISWVRQEIQTMQATCQGLYHHQELCRLADPVPSQVAVAILLQRPFRGRPRFNGLTR